MPCECSLVGEQSECSLRVGRFAVVDGGGGSVPSPVAGVALGECGSLEVAGAVGGANVASLGNIVGVGVGVHGERAVEDGNLVGVFALAIVGNSPAEYILAKTEVAYLVDGGSSIAGDLGNARGRSEILTYKRPLASGGRRAVAIEGVSIAADSSVVAGVSVHLVVVNRDFGRLLTAGVCESPEECGGTKRQVFYLDSGIGNHLRHLEAAVGARPCAILDTVNSRIGGLEGYIGHAVVELVGLGLDFGYKGIVLY